MKMKKLFCCILTVVILSISFFSGCNTSNKETITPTVWQVTSPDGKKCIYMMGSIHVADESVNNMPDYFEKIYSLCDSLAVEVDINDVTNNTSDYSSIIKKMMYNDGTRINDHISEDIYKKAVDILKQNDSYSAFYDRLTPMMWISLIENVIYKKSGLNADYGVDTVLISRADSDNKKVLEVESLESQITLLSDIDDELQEMMLASYVQDGVIEEETKSITQLYNKWKTGTITYKDVNGDVDLNKMTDEQIEMLDKYNKMMLDDRNIGMADKAEEYINGDNTVLFVVGAAHFYGDKGILQLMKDRGYTVTQISSNDFSTIQASAA